MKQLQQYFNKERVFRGIKVTGQMMGSYLNVTLIDCPHKYGMEESVISNYLFDSFNSDPDYFFDDRNNMIIGLYIDVYYVLYTYFNQKRIKVQVVNPYPFYDMFKVCIPATIRHNNPEGFTYFESGSGVIIINKTKDVRIGIIPYEKGRYMYRVAKANYRGVFFTKEKGVMEIPSPKEREDLNKIKEIIVSKMQPYLDSYDRKVSAF